METDNILNNSANWDEIYKNITETNKWYKVLGDSIRHSRSLNLTLAGGQEDKIEVFRTQNNENIFLYLKLEDCPIRFKVHTGHCTAKELHSLFEGGSISAKCLFEGFNTMMLKPDIEFIVTPEGKEEKPIELIPGENYTGYVKNWTEENGIFIYCEGNDGLIKINCLGRSDYRQDFRSGKIGKEYPIGSEIEICVCGITTKSNGKRQINMDLKGSVTVKDMADNGETLDLKISEINQDRTYMMVDYLGQKCLTLIKSNEPIPFKQRIANNIYRIGRKVKVQVFDKDIKRGLISFALTDTFEDYGIQIGETLPAEIKDGKLYVLKDGNKWQFDMMASINMSHELQSICKGTCLDVMARCVEIIPSGEPRFNIDLPIQEYLGSLDEGTVIEATVLGASDRLVGWYHNKAFGGIKTDEAGFYNAIPDEFTRNRTIRLKVTRTEDGRSQMTFADQIANPWDTELEIKTEDIIEVQLMEQRPNECEYRFRYKNLIGFLGAEKKPKTTEGLLWVKVVYINTSTGLLCAIPCDDITEKNIPEGDNIKICPISYIHDNMYWVRRNSKIYLAHLENDYPKYVKLFLFKENKIQKVTVRKASETHIDISFPYDHDAIDAFTKKVGDEIYPTIEGLVPEGFILKTQEGLYCLLPFKEVGWNSHIYVDHGMFTTGQQITVRILAIENRNILVTCKNADNNPWERYNVNPGESVDCIVVGRKQKDRSLIVDHNGLYGQIQWEDISWFDVRGVERYPKGTHITAVVDTFDSEKRQLRLRRVDLTGNPWETISLQKGSDYRVTVLSVSEKCAIVSTQYGYEGYISLDNISYLKHTDCRMAVKTGDTFEARLSLIDPENRLLEFDRKVCLPAPDCNAYNAGDIHEATIIRISPDGLHLDINGNPGYIAPMAARQFIYGASKTANLKEIFTVGEKREVKICRTDPDLLYATAPDGQTYEDKGCITCRITNIQNSTFILETLSGKKAILPCTKASWSGYSEYEYKIGDEIDVNISGFTLIQDEYTYKSERMTLVLNPWSEENNPPKIGDLLRAKVIAILDDGQVLASHGQFTAPLSHTHLLTDTPWDNNPDKIQSLKVGDELMVRVSEWNSKERIIGFVPYPDSNNLDKTACDLNARHITPEGIYAYSKEYDWFCFVPKNEIYWSPLDDATGHIEINEDFTAELIRYDDMSGLFIMSIRNLLAKPERSIKVGQTITGTVAKITSNSVVIRFSDFEGILNFKEEGLTPEEFSTGQDIKTRVISRSPIDEISLSIRLANNFNITELTRNDETDGFMLLKPGHHVKIEYITDNDVSQGKYDVRVNGNIDCMCIGPDKIIEGYISGINHKDRTIAVSEKCPDMRIPHTGTFVKCRPKGYDSHSDTLLVDFMYKGINYEGRIPSGMHDWIPEHGESLIRAFENNRSLSITAAINSLSGDVYTLDAKNMASNPMDYLKLQPTIQAHVLTSTPDGFIIQYSSLMGLVPFRELSWQLCDIKFKFWKIGEIINVKYLGIDKNTNRKMFSHKQAISNPFKNRVLKPGQEYSAIVKRTLNKDNRVIVELKNTDGIEAAIDQASVSQAFSLSLPRSGYEIKKVRIEKIWKSNDPGFYGRITVSIVDFSR